MSPTEALAFEAAHPENTPTKRVEILQLGLTEPRYYTLLTRAASSLEGIAADPITARLVRQRAQRAMEAREARVA